DEYGAYGRENLVIEWQDPDSDPEVERRCRALGIPQVQLNIIEKDKAQVANAYLGIAIQYEDRSEVIPIVQNVDNLEYELTAAIIKVYQREPKTVALVGGNPDVTLEAGLSVAKAELERQYEVVTADLASGAIDPDVQTLVLVQPDALGAAARYAIDQFVMRGGAVLVYIDAIKLAEGLVAASPRESGIGDLLRHYGVEVGPNLVLDRTNESAAFNQGFITFSVPYPFWPKITRAGMNEKNPMVNQLEGLVMPWVSSVAASPDAPDAIAVDTLVSSSPFAWKMTDRFDLNPQQRFPNAPRDPQSAIPLAVVASGAFPSFHDEATIAAEGLDGANFIATGAETRVVVVGTANAVLDEMIQQFPMNTLFLQNAVDWLTLGNDLISIRSRGATDRPLKEVSEKGKTWIRFLVTFGVPLLVILLGLVRWGQIRNRRAAGLGGVKLS
ncbi:MAG: GldG family protein, partial [Gemmatimonadetes bacterium]|nr:GldG family protein [Gemmatimonadota bacterium]